MGVALDPERRCAWVIASGGTRKVQNLLAAGPTGGRLAACQVDGARWSTLEGAGRRSSTTPTRWPAPASGTPAATACRGANPERVAIRITVDRFVGSTALFG